VQRNRSHCPPNAAVFQVESNYSLELHFVHKKPHPFAKGAADPKRPINLLTTNQLEPLGNLAFLKEDTNWAVSRPVRAGSSTSLLFGVA